ncbi:MAG: hypothetical protein ABW194_01720 [Novosphingobium sp.]
MKQPAQLVHHAPPEYAGLGPLPVRVRKRTGEIVGSGVTGTPIAVPPGSYFVTILLPDGREVGHDHKVRAVAGGVSQAPQFDDPGVATTAPVPPVAPRSARFGAKSFARRGPNTVRTAEPAPPAPAPLAAPATTTAGPGELSIAAGLWEGDWMGAWAGGVPDLTGLDTGSLSLSSGQVLTLAHREGLDRLLVLPLEDRFRCAVIPFDECTDCTDARAGERAIGARLTASGDGPVVLFRSVASEETNALLAFVETWIVSHMATISDSQVRTSEEAMAQARRSIFRAITGAYVVLRANALDGLDDLLAQLEPMQGHLPDVLPLRAELAARLGDHAAAVALIAKWLEGGRCPWFRAGFSYMLERLKIYLDVTDNHRATFNLDSEDYGRFAAARDILDRMLPTMITSYYIATFDIPRAG